LIRGPQVLEDTRKIDTVLLDKTGTITEGNLEVTSTQAVTGITEAELIAFAGAAEAGSEHPIAQAIVRAASASAKLIEASTFNSAPGGGVIATVSGKEVVIGRTNWLLENGVELSEANLQQLKAAQESGATAILVAIA